jgi:predicted DNA binding CopG/RHH family protein
MNLLVQGFDWDEGNRRAICTRRRLPPMKRKVPRLKTDKEAEAFLAQDLSNLEFSQFKPARFEFEKKDGQINMRVPKPLLAAVKARARARGIPYTRFIRETLERAMTAPK